MVEVDLGPRLSSPRAMEKGLEFDTVVAQYQTRIARYIMRLVNDPELALDLTQDTFVNAFRNIHTLRSDLALSAWLYRIATNLSIHARRKSRRMEVEPLANHENNTRIATAAPDQRVIDRELFHNALMQLPRERAACLLLHIKEGFNYAEVASIVGTTPEGARKRIARAKEQFRTAYDQTLTETARDAMP
jgi:RNA polymerase sigma-70 factor, ECF subfamily